MRKNVNSPASVFLAGFFLLLVFVFKSQLAWSQKVLNQQETKIVEDAYAELQEAISNPDLSENERTRLVEHSARTLKEYGQPAAFPEDGMPLKKMMEYNYQQGRKEFEDANDLRQALSNKLLDQQLKIINTMQIEVTEEQVKLLIPGSQPLELSKDLVNTVFDWNIAEGFNSGKAGDAKSLANRFKQMAETKQLIKKLESLYNSQQMSMNNLHHDLIQVEQLETRLRKKYEITEASTFTLKGMEGTTATENSNTGLAKSNPYLLDPQLIGTWLHTDNNKKQSGWQFNTDGTAVQYIRSEQIPGWTWEVRSGMLYIIGGNNKSEDYNYKFENGNLYMEVTLLGKNVWSAPMKKQ